MSAIKPQRLGEMRPSQAIFTYGVGALIDLPNFSVIVSGLDDWQVRTGEARTIVEDRLLRAVQQQLGQQVGDLIAPPSAKRMLSASPFDRTARIGVPVALFPRWLYCPMCQRLAPWSDGLFEVDEKPFHPERTRIVHSHCEKTKGNVKPQVVPARFLVACENGHLDDFPWVAYVHRGASPCRAPVLYLSERTPTGEARDIWVECHGDGCTAKQRPLSEAFGEEARANLPGCRGRRPHLRDFEETPCPSDLRPILLGASNLWFGDAITALAIPSDENRLDQMVEERWNQFEDTPDLATLERERKKYPGAFTDFITIPSTEIWAAIERKRARDVRGAADDPSDLKGPEWERFTHPEQQQPTRDFQLRAVTIPRGFETTLDQVVLVERLREVRALLGFTRIDAPGELGEGSDGTQARRARLTRGSPTWVPAAEVRGEGIFIQVREVAIQRWLSRGVVDLRNAQFEESHMVWRRVRNIEPLEAGYPGMRYVLLHTFAHALMRQLVLECGYTAASIRERIYARGPRENPDRPDPMAGILIYTAAPDSEGTLGGLVSLGEPQSLARILTGALFDASICTSDPLCAEHAPDRQGISVHGAACHSCQFAPETSCERGNKYLDRSVLVPTFNQHDLAFFEAPS